MVMDSLNLNTYKVIYMKNILTIIICQLTQKIAIINSSGKYSGIGHYSYDLSLILDAKLYTLVYDNKHALYPGKPVTSFLPKFPGRYKFLIKFQNIIFKK